VLDTRPIVPVSEPVGDSVPVADAEPLTVSVPANCSEPLADAELLADGHAVVDVVRQRDGVGEPVGVYRADCERVIVGESDAVAVSVPDPDRVADPHGDPVFVCAVLD